MSDMLHADKNIFQIIRLIELIAYMWFIWGVKQIK